MLTPVTIVLQGGTYDGRLIYDHEVMMVEGDRIRITGSGQPVDTFYLVYAHGVAIECNGRARIPGRGFEISAEELS